MDPDDRQTVVTVEEEPAPAPTEPKGRVGAAQLLEAIRQIPQQTAAAVKGEASPTKGGERSEVTFVGEPEPEPDEAEPEPGETPPGQPDPPVVHRRRFRHPAARRRRAEAML